MKNRNFTNQAHIMLEVTLPLSILMGCNNIYTFGWDGPKIKDGVVTEYNYEYTSHCSLIQSYKLNQNNTKYLEYPYIHIIDKLLLEENINVYKCNEISNINLRYQNILPE